MTTLHGCLAQAARTAKLAFAGQTVKRHQEFEIGVHDKNDLASFLSRCDTVLASVQNAAKYPVQDIVGNGHADGRPPHFVLP